MKSILFNIPKDQRKAFYLSAGFVIVSFATVFLWPYIVNGTSESGAQTQAIRYTSTINVDDALGPLGTGLYIGINKDIAVGDVFLRRGTSNLYQVKQIVITADDNYIIYFTQKDFTEHRSYRQFLSSRGKNNSLPIIDFIEGVEKVQPQEVLGIFETWNDITEQRIAGRDQNQINQQQILEQAARQAAAAAPEIEIADIVREPVQVTVSPPEPLLPSTYAAESVADDYSNEDLIESEDQE